MKSDAMYRVMNTVFVNQRCLCTLLIVVMFLVLLFIKLDCFSQGPAYYRSQKEGVMRGISEQDHVAVEIDMETFSTIASTTASIAALTEADSTVDGNDLAVESADLDVCTDCGMAGCVMYSDIDCTKRMVNEFNCIPTETVDSVEKFVLFIGYPRSSHSIVGSMLDAHPNMAIAHEYLLLKTWVSNVTMAEKLKDRVFLFDQLYRDSYCEARIGWRSVNDKLKPKGYTLQLNSSWQGRYDALKVIGDKSGGRTTQLYAEAPERFARAYKELVQTVRVPVHVIYVVRNPYDIVATSVLYKGHGAYKQYLAGHYNGTYKYRNMPLLRNQTDTFFQEAQAVTDMIHALNLTVLEIHNADFTKDPKGTIMGVCQFLEVECSDEYLQACYDKTYKEVSKTREVIEWSRELIDTVHSKMKKYWSLTRYSFDSD